MCGIICYRTCAHLLKESELTIQTALNICRANKATSFQLKSLSATSSSKEAHYDVFAVQKHNPSDKLDLNVTNMEINTTVINLAPHKVWNVTTVVKRTTLPKYAEPVPLQGTTRKYVVLHDMKVLIPLTSFSLI